MAELKIWYGEKAHQKGLLQLVDYLTAQGLERQKAIQSREKQRHKNWGLAVNLNFTDIYETDMAYFLTKKISIFDRNRPEVKFLDSAISCATKQDIGGRCLPIFRDAVIFYNKNNEIVEVLNICFSCYYMQNKRCEDLSADGATYAKLKYFLKNSGHEIE